MILSSKLLPRSFMERKTLLTKVSSKAIFSTRPMSSETKNTKLSPIATADLCDVHISSPQRLFVAEPCLFQSYGKINSFHGKIETVRCFESNPLVRETLGEPGENRVLVVDGGGSKRCAILGDMLASMAVDNGWAGLVINGCIRDSKVINNLNVGVKALGTHPLKSIKEFRGERGGRVTFAGIEFVPGHWLYSDEDGIVISDSELNLPAT